MRRTSPPNDSVPAGMSPEQENSSLPLLLAMSGAVFLVALGGWYLLDDEPPPPPVPMSAPTLTVVEPQSAADENKELLDEASPSPAADGADISVELPDPATALPEDPGLDIESEMLKAQLAADAEIFLYPEDQSALHYYGNVLDAEPGNAVANAELDTVLAQVSQTVSAHLAANRYQEAYGIAALVAARRPGHALVVNTQQALDERTQTLVEEAIALTQSGDDDAAVALLAEAERLPGHSADYFVAVRSSIAEIQTVRSAAEADRQQRSQLEAEQAKAAWIERIETALADGNLVSPDGASARDLLAEDNAWEAEALELTGTLMARLSENIAAQIEAGTLASAETLLATAREIDAEFDGLDDLATRVESEIITAESARVAPLDELVRIKMVPARYPRRAEDRGVSGWVDVLFTVTTDGTTDNIEVAGAEPESVFDSAAMEAVRQWEFEPKVFRGQIIPQQSMARLSFVLSE